MYKKAASLLSIITLLLLIYSVHIEPNQLSVHHEKINHSENNSNSVKIVQISDLHINRIQKVHHKIVKALELHKPEIVVITGDAVDKAESLPLLSQFLVMIPEEITIISIMGNWEHWAEIPPAYMKEFYSRHNAELLINETAQIFHNDDTILISGLDDQLGGIPSLTDALDSVTPSKNHIILAHCPDDYIKKEIQNLNLLNKEHNINSYSISATLSGHTHGGQITLFGKPLFLPHGSNGHASGWYDENSIYVSRGVGSSILPIRFMAKPEITLFTMYL